MSINGTRHLPHANPCSGFCTHSLGNYVCNCCGRTIPEARDWNRYTKEERVAVKQKCKVRLAQLKDGRDPNAADLWDD